MIQRSERRRLRDLSLFRRGGGLALGQPVDLVVEQQDLHVHVAPQRMDEVIAPDGERIAVTRHDPNVQVGPRRRDAGGDGRRASMNGMNAIGVHVVHEPSRAPDAGNEHDALGRNPQLGQEPLHRGQDGVVATAGTPPNLLVGGEVLLGQLTRGHVKLSSVSPLPIPGSGSAGPGPSNSCPRPPGTWPGRSWPAARGSSPGSAPSGSVGRPRRCWRGAG